MISSQIQLREFQKQALSLLGAGSRAKKVHLLCVAPTGSGKSLIYETLAHKGRRTLLLTPLVSLARQQHSKLKALGVDSRLSAGGQKQKPPTGKTGVWILSPEALPFPATQEAIAKFAPDLLVVDECHCLWEWGEGFRPAFQFIPALLQDHPIKQSLWLTATMPFEARAHLRESLKVAEGRFTEIGEFDLPQNLSLFVNRIPWPQRIDALQTLVQELRGPGIIFVQTREATVRVSNLLGAMGRGSIVYHAGMSAEERLAVEQQVSTLRSEIVVSTSAFGMGMDYPHLKWSLLWQAPPSLLTLSQMSGRVGRSDQGRAFVFWDDDDFRLIEWMAQSSDRKRRELLRTRDFLRDARCRRASLQGYFDGESSDHARCGRCDICISLV